MSDTGWKSPGTVTEDTSVGSSSWNNYGNVTADDGNVAENNTTNFSGGETYYIKCLNFGFNIPIGATIDGIEARVQKFSDIFGSTGAVDGHICIVKGGSIGSQNKALSGYWDFNDRNAYSTYGGSSDKWGESWLYSDINSSNFGIVVSASDPDTTSDINAQIDHIQIKVYYTDNSTPVVGQKYALPPFRRS